MKGHDPKILLALLVALTAHLLVLYFGQRAVRRDLGWWMEVPATVFPDEDKLGQAGGRGRAINSEAGTDPMIAAFADPRQDQPVMQREPTGFQSRAMPERAQMVPPAPAAESESQIQSQNNSASSEALADPSPPEILQDLQADADSPKAAKGKLNSTPSEKQEQAAEQNRKQPAQSQQAQPQQNQQQAQQSSQASPASSGNPLPSSDFESVPVTKISGRFRPGNLDAQAGRRWKARKLPELSVAGLADLSTMANPYVVLQLTIDETGNVIDVKTIRSSGSVDLDHPSEQAAATWWFEPVKNPKTGKIGREIIEFTIEF
jgi:TonB family protein